jgi:hypothetical protein
MAVSFALLGGLAMAAPGKLDPSINGSQGRATSRFRCRGIDRQEEET